MKRSLCILTATVGLIGLLVGAGAAAQSPAAASQAPAARPGSSAADQVNPSVDTSANPAVDTSANPAVNTSALPAAAAATAAPSAAAEPPAPKASAAGRDGRQAAGAKGGKNGAAERTAARGPNTVDRLELGTTEISGNRELPKVMYVVPWRRPELGDPVGRPPNSLVDEALRPVDRQVFQRQNHYYAALEAGTGSAKSQPGAAVGAAASASPKDER